MLNLIIFGPPGAGKGTQSKIIAQTYNLIHLSTGDLLREEIATGSPLGNKISQMIDDGNYVTDEMAMEMVERFIEKNKNGNGFVFDGFPRTVNQAEWLDKLLAKFAGKVNAMMSLEVDEYELQKRLLDRGKYLGRPDDQDKEIIKTRLNLYHKRTAPVKAYYQNNNSHFTINGMGSMKHVFERIKNLVSAISVTSPL